MTELVQRAKLHDTDAWGELYQRTFRETYFVALKVCGKEEDAQDLTQEAYITAYERLDQLENPDSFQTWLNMIVANKCRDYIKKKKPSLFTEFERDDGTDFEWADDREQVLPEQALDHQETVWLVQEIIGQLPEDQKLCLLLYYRENLSVGQIAGALDVSEGTVKSRLNYARKKVKAKVLDLEKQGTKLYGMAPLPFLLWLLQSDAEGLTLPVLPVAATTVGGTAATHVTAKTGAIGMRALLQTTAAKALLPVALIGSITGGLLIAQQLAENAPEPLPVVETQQSSAQQDESSLTTAQQASAAMAAILATGQTGNHLPIRYYAYLDLDQDGIPELLVANGSPSARGSLLMELLTWQNGAVQTTVRFYANNPAIHIVNEKYLRITSNYETIWDVDFYAPDDSFQMTNARWFYSLHASSPAMRPQAGCWNASGEEIPWEPIPQSMIEYYLRLPGEDAEECFALTAQEVILQENTACDIPGEIIDAGTFSLTVPPAWKGIFTYEVGEGYIKIYEAGSRDIAGGFVMNIQAKPADASGLDQEPHWSTVQLGQFTGHDGTIYQLEGIMPSDVQFAMEFAWEYQILTEDCLHITELLLYN